MPSTLRAVSDGLRLPVIVVFYLIDRCRDVVEQLENRLLARSIRPDYVRVGGCNATGQCCRHIVLDLGNGLEAGHRVTRWLSRWQRFRYNLSLIEITDKAISYRCNYLSEDNRCRIYRLRPKLCRDFPLQSWRGRPNLHKGCGYRFLQPEVVEFKVKLHGKSVLTAPQSAPAGDAGSQRGES